MIQKLSAHTYAQAAAAARASGELIFRRLDPASPIAKANQEKLGRLKLLNPDRTVPSTVPSTVPPAAPALPPSLGPFKADSINFDNGVAANGSMSLALFQDGRYSFSGHFHDSGAVGYDVAPVWVVVSNSGKAFTFAIKGHIGGTFSSGDRNWDFAQNGQNADVQNAWADLCDGYHWKWSVYINWDAASAVDDLVNALKTAGVVIGAVVAVVALL